jgi:hypothetical protein
MCALRFFFIYLLLLFFLMMMAHRRRLKQVSVYVPWWESALMNSLLVVVQCWG